MADNNNPNQQGIKTENYSSYEELYKSITKEGSLGLLALGATGLKLWRKKRSELEAMDAGKEERKDG